VKQVLGRAHIAQERPADVVYGALVAWRVMSVYMMELSLASFGTFLVGVLAEIVGV
jgi:hypothetical protein